MGQAWCFRGPSFSGRHWQLGSSGLWQNFAGGKEDVECTSVPWRRGKFRFLGVHPVRGQNCTATAAETVLDDSAVAASMLGDKLFTSPDSFGAHCWHAVQVFHWSRMMRGPESSCERWGSLMHCLWDSVAGWGPHRIVSRLFIRESGFQGSACDEAVIHEITLALRDRHGMDPYTRGHADTLVGASNAAAPSVDLVVRRGLESSVAAEALRVRSCPSTLLDASRVAVDKAVREGHTAVLAPLPMFVGDARTASKRRGGACCSRYCDPVAAVHRGCQFAPRQAGPFPRRRRPGAYRMAPGSIARLARDGRSERWQSGLPAAAVWKQRLLQF